MPQIGTPQENILEPIAGGYPSTTPAAAGESALLLGQTLVDDANQQTGGLAVSDKTPIPDANAKGKEQPDEPKANTVHGTVTPAPSLDPNGNKVSDSNIVFSSGTTGGAYDVKQAARGRALDASGKVHNMTILAAPKTGGSGTGYGAFSGGTPGGAATATRVVQGLTFTAAFPGLQGNAVGLVYEDTGTAGAETVSVAGGVITVSMEDDASTAAQIKAAILASSDALSLLSVAGASVAVQTLMALTKLTGGTNTPAEGEGALTNSKGVVAAINRVGSRNNASINVIHRPGDNQAPFLY